MSERQTPLQVYARLPKSNCRRCYFPSCLAFAAAVCRGERRIYDCPLLTADQPAVRREETGPPEAGEQRQALLAELQREVAGLDLAAVAPRIGGEFVGGRLLVRCLGKGFWVDSQGQVSSECHTHCGLVIPLLRYVIQAGGTGQAGADGPPVWVNFRELKNGAAHGPLFARRAELTLRNLADRHPGLFEDLIAVFSGREEESAFGADVSLVLYPLPRVSVLICYWRPERDLDSELKLFFDQGAEDFLPVDSLYALGVGMVMMFEKIALVHG